jgi:hypothetical protein
MNASQPRKNRKIEPTTSNTLQQQQQQQRRNANNNDPPQASSSSTPMIMEQETSSNGRESKENLCKMVLGKIQYGAAQQLWVHRLFLRASIVLYYTSMDRISLISSLLQSGEIRGGRLRDGGCWTGWEGVVAGEG